MNRFNYGVSGDSFDGDNGWFDSTAPPLTTREKIMKAVWLLKYDNEEVVLFSSKKKLIDFVESSHPFLTHKKEEQTFYADDEHYCFYYKSRVN